MEDLDHILDDITNPDTGSLHGAVFIAVDKSGNTIYQKASGRTSVDPDGAKPLQINALYWVASMTKLVTAVSVIQLVERGILSLDDDVREKLPELKDIQLLNDMKYDPIEGRAKPELHPIQGKITLRAEGLEKIFMKLIQGLFSNMLCHTAGFVYDTSSPLLHEWSKYHGRKAHTFCGSIAGYELPLLFQPGTAWAYGAGLDWAGKLIEHVTGSTLGDYMQDNIWSKLGATSTTFHPEKRPDSLPPLLAMGNRKSVGQGVKSVSQGDIILESPVQDDLGGIGLYSTPTDFMKLLTALLQGGGPLLSNASVDLLFSPQLSEITRTAMPKLLGKQMRRLLGIKDVNDVDQADHCLGGTVTLKDIPGRRTRETVNWSGLPNLHWWVDRKTGVAAALFTQLLPLGDAAVTDLTIELEKALYRNIRLQRGHLNGNARL